MYSHRLGADSITRFCRVDCPKRDIQHLWWGFDYDFAVSIPSTDRDRRKLFWKCSFVIDSLSELESFMVGENCCMCKSCGTSNRKGEQIGGVLRIVNCPKLKSITVSLTAFFYYDSFVLKNLPSLQSIEIGFCSLGFSSFSLTGKTWIEWTHRFPSTQSS